jgi:hypothetical protein
VASSSYLARFLLAVRVLRGKGVIYRVHLTHGDAVLNFVDSVPDVHVVDCTLDWNAPVLNKLVGPYG